MDQKHKIHFITGKRKRKRSKNTCFFNGKQSKCVNKSPIILIQIWGRKLLLMKEYNHERSDNEKYTIPLKRPRLDYTVYVFYLQLINKRSLLIQDFSCKGVP